MHEETCSSGCKRPPQHTVPLPVRIVWRVWGWVTWPWAIRELKRAGFVRTGWRRWETP